MGKKSSIDLQTKLKIIAYSDSHPTESKLAIAKFFNVKKDVVYRALSQRDTIANAPCTIVKRIKQAEYPELENGILSWFKQTRSENLPVDGPLLKEKALQLADALGIKEFQGSEGWLSRFKKRNSIIFKSVQGEAGDVAPADTEIWREEILPNLLKQYKPYDIYNIDECGLFYQLLPDRTLSFIGEKCEGGKLSKQRLTVLLVANMSGSDKLPPLVIGKFARPRCFKNVHRLPVSFEANKRAWMTSDIFEKYIKAFDQKMAARNRRILLIIDNCSAHPIINGLLAIRLEFLPPNTTSRTQPMDQGVIHSFKTHYRKLLLRSRLAALDANRQYNCTVLDALHHINAAWTSVSSVTIANCFTKAGMIPNNTDNEVILLEPFNQELNFVSSSQEDDEFAQFFAAFKEKFPTASAAALQDYINIDQTLVTTGSRSITDIALDIQAASSSEIQISDSEDNDDDTICDYKPPSNSDALLALETLRSFIDSHEYTDSCLKQYNALRDSIHSVCTRSLVQSDITKFFSSQ